MNRLPHLVIARRTFETYMLDENKSEQGAFSSGNIMTLSNLTFTLPPLADRTLRLILVITARVFQIKSLRIRSRAGVICTRCYEYRPQYRKFCCRNIYTVHVLFNEMFIQSTRVEANTDVYTDIIVLSALLSYRFDLERLYYNSAVLIIYYDNFLLCCCYSSFTPSDRILCKNAKRCLE